MPCPELLCKNIFREGPFLMLINMHIILYFEQQTIVLIVTQFALKKITVSKHCQSKFTSFRCEFCDENYICSLVYFREWAEELCLYTV